MIALQAAVKPCLPQHQPASDKSFCLLKISHQTKYVVHPSCLSVRFLVMIVGLALPKQTLNNLETLTIPTSLSTHASNCFGSKHSSVCPNDCLTCVIPGSQVPTFAPLTSVLHSHNFNQRVLSLSAESLSPRARAHIVSLIVQRLVRRSSRRCNEESGYASR